MVLLFGLPLYIILKEQAHGTVGKGRKNSTWIFFSLNIESIAHFETFCHRKLFQTEIQTDSTSARLNSASRGIPVRSVLRWARGQSEEAGPVYSYLQLMLNC